ncbi:type 1 glutamine amidotransferase [Cellulomonas triticagri]|uniref:Type 1 glutamine amidotransferase n=1 Tax=Cellulomonas triticagri TaxID=2483352 RepID=A0A3M2IYL4_9CELL|nr:type 1 glutamine amidotransferase [Cellulomonas triticagri]RMI04906.1 type 1 glutamine amidotransferase [Cellulomonas triticagri]
MTPRPVLVLTHVAHEGPGLIARALDGLPLTTRTVVDDPAARLPRVEDLAGLVVMGGPQDADDDAGHPGLAAERRLLAEAVDAGLPTLGVCLGMQLLALALGSPLHRRHGTEIGFAPVDVVAHDPLLAAAGARPTVLHWHSDAVDLPAGATLLARTDVTPVQAFRAGSAVGVQFHLEVDAGVLDLWLDTPGMVADLEPGEADAIRLGSRQHLAALRPGADLGLAAFAEQVRERA